MIQIDHIINDVDGLHARPIAELADIAKKLGIQIFILINGYNEDNASELVKEYIKNNL